MNLHETNQLIRPYQNLGVTELGSSLVLIVSLCLSYNILIVSLDFFSFWFKTRLTICEGHDGTDTSNGDVLIFPDMVRYR